MPTINHILFPFDFSVQGVRATPFVRALAQRFGARVTPFSAASPRSPAQLDEALPTELDGVPVDRVADSGDPAYRIVEFAHTHGSI